MVILETWDSSDIWSEWSLDKKTQNESLILWCHGSFSSSQAVSHSCNVFVSRWSNVDVFASTLPGHCKLETAKKFLLISRWKLAIGKFERDLLRKQTSQLAAQAVSQEMFNETRNDHLCRRCNAFPNAFQFACKHLLQTGGVLTWHGSWKLENILTKNISIVKFRIAKSKISRISETLLGGGVWIGIRVNGRWLCRLITIQFLPQTWQSKGGRRKHLESKKRERGENIRSGEVGEGVKAKGGKW